jgi:hypothetical protein
MFNQKNSRGKGVFDSSMNQEIKLDNEVIDYISTWIIDEVDDYGGTTINDLPIDHEPKPMKSLNDYDVKTLAKAIYLAIESHNGGARNE